MSDRSLNELTLLKDEKRELWKAEKHAYNLLHTIDQLRDEVMPPRRYAETMQRLRKEAGFMARRLSQMVGREISVFEKLDFNDEYYGRKNP